MKKKIGLSLGIIMVIILAISVFVGCSSFKTTKKGFISLENASENYFVAELDNGKMNVVNTKGKKLLDSDYDELISLSFDGELLFAKTRGVDGGEIVSVNTGKQIYDLRNVPINAEDITLTESIVEEIYVTKTYIKRSYTTYLMTYVENSSLNGVRIDSNGVERIFQYQMPESDNNYSVSFYSTNTVYEKVLDDDFRSTANVNNILVTCKVMVEQQVEDNACVLNGEVKIVNVYTGDSIRTEHLDFSYQNTDYNLYDVYHMTGIKLIVDNAEKRSTHAYMGGKTYEDIVDIDEINDFGYVVTTKNDEGVTKYEVVNPKDNVAFNVEGIDYSIQGGIGYVSGNSNIKEKDVLCVKDGEDTYSFYNNQGQLEYQAKNIEYLRMHGLHDLDGKVLFDFVTSSKILEYTDSFNILATGDKYTIALVDSSKYVILEHNKVIGTFDGNNWGQFTYDSKNKMFSCETKSIMLEGKEKGQIVNEEKIVEISGYQVTTTATYSTVINELESQNVLNILKYQDPIELGNSYIRIKSITENMGNVDIVYTVGETNPQERVKSLVYNKGFVEVYDGVGSYKIERASSDKNTSQLIYKNDSESYAEMVSNVVIYTYSENGDYSIEVRKTILHNLSALNSDYFTAEKNGKKAILNKEFKALTPYMFTSVSMNINTNYAVVKTEGDIYGVIQLTKKSYKIIQDFAARPIKVEFVIPLPDYTLDLSSDFYYTIEHFDKDGNLVKSLYKNNKAVIKDAVDITPMIGAERSKKHFIVIGSYTKNDGKEYLFTVESKWKDVMNAIRS